MKRQRTYDAQTLTLPIAVAAVLCLCAASGTGVDQSARVTSIEARTLNALLASFAPPGSFASGNFALGSSTSHASLFARNQTTPCLISNPPAQLTCLNDDAVLPHATPLREALVNLPPPAAI